MKQEQELRKHLLLMLSKKELSVTIDGKTYTGNEAVELPDSKLFSKNACYSVTSQGIGKYIKRET